MTPELQDVVAYWLEHPFRFVAVWALLALVDGFARAAGRDLIDTWKRRREQ